MKKHQRRISRRIGSGYGHYNFEIEYPSGKKIYLKNIPNAPLYNAIGDLESNVISVNHGIWSTLSSYINNQK